MRKRPTSEQFAEKLQHMVDTLRSEIVDGTYVYGELLPSEMDHAARFGLSNKSVRKGMEILVEEGWIEKIPRVGSRVVMKSRSNVTLTLAVNPIAQRNLELVRLLAEFERDHPWITVSIKETGGIPGFSKHGDFGNADVVSADNFQFQRLIEANQVQNLQPLQIDENIYPSLTRQFIRNGEALMRPLIFSPIVLVYNKAHFREKGLPEPDGSWTWDDMMRTAEQLSNGKDQYGFCFRAQDVNRWPIFLLQSGESFTWDGDKLKDIRESRMLEGLRLYREIIHNRKASPLYFSDNNEDINQMFLKGNLSMVTTSFLGLNAFKHTDLEFDVSPIPYIHEPRSLLICLGLGINRMSPHQEEAAMLLRYLTSARGWDFIYNETLSLPASRFYPKSDAPKSYMGSEINRPSRYGHYREMMFSYRTHRDLNIPTAAFPKIFNHLKAYLAYMIDEDELCDRINSILSELIEVSLETTK